MTGSGDAAGASPLPLTAEGVTAAWLSAALRTRYAGVVITQVEPVQTIDGTATKVLLRLAYGPHTLELRASVEPAWIWNNDGDSATVIDPYNVAVSRYR